jgi:exopolysaccharide production protein ExoQ
MIFWLAFLICSAGVAGLFYLDRDKSVRNSKALWLPVIWIGIAGSRPVTTWFGTGGGSEVGLASTLDGSPMDAAIYAALVAVGVIVLLRWDRKKRTSAFLAANGLLIAYFLYCLISVTWSPIHGPAFKRWIKAIGDLVMVFVIVTDGQPVAALRRLYSRVGFILFPFSIFLIRYTDMGRGYTPDGAPENTGVTTNKNSLGLIVFLVSLGALWNARSLLLDKKAPHRTQRLVAQSTLLTFGIVLLQMAHSATAVACFILGAGFMLLTTRRALRNRPGRVYALCLAIVLGGGLAMFFGGGSVVSNALGRGNGLSGRTDIWKASISAADDPLFGTGFESFWNTNIEKVAAKLPGYWEIHNLVSAHNGYIEVYLDLGLVGVCLIALIILNGYRRGSKAFQRQPEIGGLILAYIVTATFYSLTEAGFRVLTPMWIFLLLALIIASGVATGIFGGGGVKSLALRRGRARRAAASDKQIPEGETVRAVRSGLNQFEIDNANNSHHA